MILKKLSFLSLAFAIVFSCNNSIAESTEASKQTVQTLVNIFANLKTGSDGKLDPGQLAQADRFINYVLMARRALGEVHWQALSEKQKAAYLETFKNLIEQRYYTRWHKIFAKSTFEYLSDGQKGTDILINSSISTGKSKKQIVWTLTGQPAKVVNLTVEDRDLLLRLHNRFQTKISKLGLASFIAWMQNAAQEADEQTK